LLVIALGYDSKTALGCPAKEDLSRSLPVLGGNACDDFVLEKGLEFQGLFPTKFNETLGAEGRIGSHGNALLFSEAEECWLNEVGVMLDLKAGNRNFSVAEDVHDKGTLEVGDTDGADEVLLDTFFEGLPGLLDGDIDRLYTMVYTIFVLVGPFCGVVLGVVDVFEGNREVNQEEIEVPSSDKSITT
jgi:hypothetical protein